ncbi:MAG: hypothetical protein OER88_04165 [Planctomycetota bacterium]|nr:hypothetical protein [Planctomycetota bacterium]
MTKSLARKDDEVSDWKQRLARHRKKFGFKAATAMVADRVLHKLVGFDVQRVIRLEVDNISPRIETPQDFECRFLSPAEVSAFARDPHNYIGGEFAMRAAVGFDLCFAAIHIATGRLAAYGWYALDCIEPEHNAGTALSYDRTMAYMYKGFTHPDFRGNRLHGVLMAGALRALCARGVRSLISTVHWTNLPSLRSCERLGYETIGSVTSVKLAGRRLRKCPRTEHVAYGRRARVRPPVRVATGSEAPVVETAA